MALGLEGLILNPLTSHWTVNCRCEWCRFWLNKANVTITTTKKQRHNHVVCKPNSAPFIQGPLKDKNMVKHLLNIKTCWANSHKSTVKFRAGVHPFSFHFILGNGKSFPESPASDPSVKYATSGFGRSSKYVFYHWKSPVKVNSSPCIPLCLPIPFIVVAFLFALYSSSWVFLMKENKPPNQRSAAPASPSPPKPPRSTNTD